MKSHNKTNENRIGRKSNFNYVKFPGFDCIFVQDTVAIATKNVAIVELHAEIGGVAFNVKGEAKRFPGDKKVPADRPDQDVAIGLAAARAFEQIAKKCRRQAEGKMIHNEKQDSQKLKSKKTTTTPKKGKKSK